MVTLKHSAFLAQLLMDEVDLGESTHGGFDDHAVFSMQDTDGPTGQVPGAKPSPNKMPVSWYDVQDPQQVLWAKGEGIKQRTRLHLLRRTWKMSIWSEEDDEEMILPDPGLGGSSCRVKICPESACLHHSGKIIVPGTRKQRDIKSSENLIT